MYWNNIVFIDMQKGPLYEHSRAFRPYSVLEDSLIHSDPVQFESE